MIVRLLDVSQLTYAQRLVAVSLQGLANRQGPRLYLDWGTYDDVRARTTNEVFLPDDIWQAKYRAYVGDSDRLNLAYYQETLGLRAEPLVDLSAAVREHLDCLCGLVVWDPALLDTVNAALMRRRFTSPVAHHVRLACHVSLASRSSTQIV